MNEKQIEKIKLVVCAIGILIGIIVIIFGINISIMEDSTQHVASLSFGADYYTESQQAMAATANNIIDLFVIMQKSFSYIFYAFGSFIICYFAFKLCTLLPSFMQEKTQVENVEENSNEKVVIEKQL